MFPQSNWKNFRSSPPNCLQIFQQYIHLKFVKGREVVGADTFEIHWCNGTYILSKCAGSTMLNNPVVT